MRDFLEGVIVSDPRLEQTLSFSEVAFENLLQTRSLSMKVPVVSLKELSELAGACQIRTIEGVLNCLQKFHELGSVLYFGTRSPQLRDLCILDPQWLIDVLSNVFTTKHRWIKQGVLKRSALLQIWKEYPESLHSWLLVLLGTFLILSTLILSLVS